MDSRVGFSDRFVEELSADLLTAQPDPTALNRKVSAVMGLDEESSKRVLYSITSELNAKLFIPVTKAELILVEGCNLACQYCFESNVLNSKRLARRVMDDDTIVKAIDLVFQYSRDSERVSITLFGGEPTLNMPGIVTAVDHANRRAADTGKEVVYNMTSNGVLFTEEMVDFFADNKIKVLLSIDGLEAAHDRYRVDRSGEGTFDRVLDGLRLLKVRQPWVGIKMTIMPSIAHTMVESVKGLHELGVNQFLIGHATGVTWERNELETYRSQMQELRSWYKENKGPTLKIVAFDKEEAKKGFFGCSAGRNSISVSCNGDITGCSRISTLEDEQTVGKLGDVDIGLYNLKMRLEMNTCGELKRNCDQAGITEQYTGGCFATNFEENRDMFRPNMLQHEFSVLLSDVVTPSTIK